MRLTYTLPYPLLPVTRDAIVHYLNTLDGLKASINKPKSYGEAINISIELEVSDLISHQEVLYLGALIHSVVLKYRG